MFFTISFFVLFILLILLVPTNDPATVYEFRQSVRSIKSITLGVSEHMKDHSIEPCQSFYHYASGSWIKNHTNENRAFTYVYRKNQKRIRDIVTSPSSGAPYALYRSCLDTLVFSKHKLETKREVNHLLNHILMRLQSHADLPVIFGRLHKHGYTAPFALTIENHPTQAKMIPLVQKEYLEMDISAIEGMSMEEMAELGLLIEFLNQVPSVTEPDSYVEYIKTQFQSDIFNVSTFGKQYEAFWKEYFLELGGPNLEHDLVLNEEMWIPQPDYVYIMHLLQNMEQLSIEQWRAYVKYSILYNAHDYMPVLPTDSYFRIHENKLKRHRKMRARETVQEQHCVALANTLLPGSVAKTYLREFMPEEEQTRIRITELAESIRDQYAQLIGESTWLTTETRNRSKKKISKIIIRAIHPNTWETEPFAARVHLRRYVFNLNMIRRYRVERNLQLWSLWRESTSDHGRDAVQRFGAPLTTVNAYYSPVTNTITVFAGIVTEPFYSPEYSPVELYATLGMIIGHELSHGMDNSGRLFDLDGSLTDWWPQQDVNGFLERANCIVQEYGPPQGCENANYGEQTLGEDIADITGITLSLRALEDKHGPLSKEDLKRFFTVFAQMWAESYTQEYLCRRVDDDVHAVAWFRVDKTLRQLEKFREAFACQPGSSMVNERNCKVYG